MEQETLTARRERILARAAALGYPAEVIGWSGLLVGEDRWWAAVMVMSPTLLQHAELALDRRESRGRA